MKSIKIEAQVILVIAAVLSLLLFIFHPAFQGISHPGSLSSTDTSNFVAIEYGLTQYLEDHDGKLPFIDKPWGLSEILYPRYISREAVFLCPHRVKSTSSTDPEISGYHFNVKVSGQSISSLDDGTIIIYEPWAEEQLPIRYKYLIARGGHMIFYASSESMQPDDLIISDEDNR